METKFSIEDIQTAYKRFKSYVYYDNFNLHIRHKISDFESEDIDKKIEELCDKLNCFCDGNSTSVFNKLIKDSGYIILPLCVHVFGIEPCIINTFQRRT